jgi:hydrogenase maturation protein HypF
MESRRIHVRGTVQGVGFRPFVWRLAREHRLRGWVQNYGSEVLIEAHGSTQMIESFVEGLQHHSLPRAVIGSIHYEPISLPSLPRNDASVPDFLILDSSSYAAIDPNIPPDVATCDACLDEMNDPGNRRYGYPFIQCNDCGPRFTIIESLPFDRARTTMRGFPLCPICEAEYRDPNNRRFHCQTIACPACGPQLEWKPTGQRGIDAVDAAIEAVHQGKIIAIQGIGGFHLACDARSDQAVSTLRARKGRGDKPLAIMVRDSNIARTLVHGPPLAWQTLIDPIHPIVVMDKRSGSAHSSAIAPGLNTLGIMLPYSPIHQLLMRNEEVPWVMTSGNRSDEPIAIDPHDAEIRLSHIADGFLIHNRPIVEACDDSVIRICGDSLQTLRRSRGMVPKPVEFTSSSSEMPCEEILATGADLKGSFCLVKGNLAYVSPPFGDVAVRETIDALQRTELRWEQWLGARPVRFAADMHPLYHASQWARDRARPRGSGPILIQHHHAHLAALMAEHQIDPDAQLLGFVFDGTGYGIDGTIWGGEAIALQDRRFHRMASLEPFPIFGGDTAIRFPYRVALSLLHHAGIPWSDDLACANACSPDEKCLFKQLLDRRVTSVATTSIGRLFDGVASLLGVRHAITYEAQAAIELEVLASQENGTNVDRDAARWMIDAMNPSSLEFPTARCIRELVDQRRSGTSAAKLARWFHAVIAQWTLRVAVQCRNAQGITAVGLTGGVFQNELLSTLACGTLESHGFQVLRHESWPCHDGSIALGQAWIAYHLPEYPR